MDTQKVKDDEIVVAKIPGERNPADLLTKAMARPRISHLLSIMGMGEPAAPIH